MQTPDLSCWYAPWSMDCETCPIIANCPNRGKIGRTGITHYLFELKRQPEKWQAQQKRGGTVMDISFNQHVDVESNQTTVIDFLDLVKRPGIESLIDYLCNSDYFLAPASTRYHNVLSGGLCQHSINVTREFSKENAKWQKPLPQDSVIICGLLHDLCKVGAYTETARGYEKVKDFPKGHGKLSVARIEEHTELTVPEKDVILCHMSLFGAYMYHDFKVWDLHKAIMRTPQVQVFAAIDMTDSKRKVLWEEF